MSLHDVDLCGGHDLYKYFLPESLLVVLDIGYSVKTNVRIYTVAVRFPTNKMLAIICN